MEYKKITFGPVRLSYPHLFTPQKSEDGGTSKYGCCILIPKSEKELVNQFKKAIQEVIPQDAPKGSNGRLVPSYKIPLRDGDLERSGEEYANMYFMNCSSNKQPGCFKKKGAELIPVTEEELYPGCWVYVNLTFFAFKKNTNQGVSAGLNCILKAKDDASFSGGSNNAAEAFADVPETVEASGADMLGGTPSAGSEDDMPDFFN